jgi:protein tyrosine/serine phosphatase
MAGIVKRTRRAYKRVTLGWRESLISRLPPGLRRALTPAATYLDMLFIDHGVLRLVYLNQHALGPQMWRSAQPAPHQIRSMAKGGITGGLKTIINLRGERLCGSYLLERRACEQMGITLVNCQVRSRAAPSREELRRVRDVFDTIEYPALLHCKSGADRAGLTSVLYRHLKEGVPLAEAKNELSLRYGHIRQADTGVLDYFFERYLTDNERRPMPFFEWVETVYDADEVKRAFEAEGWSKRWANRLVNGVLRRE